MSVDLLKTLNSVAPVPLEVQSHIAEILQYKTLRKKEYILKPGQINEIMVFIQRGLMRAYYIKDGVEIGSWFRAEGEFIVSISSFYKVKPSVEYIQALEPTEILYITRKQLYDIYHKYTDFCLNALMLTIDVLVQWDERVRVLNNTSAEERFKWLIENRRDLLQRVPDKYIAGFLGIRPETFSKAKTELFRAWQHKEGMAGC
jgi:CRP/FNR family transcriptional regulator, anaerobic regulatory protein